MDVVVDHSAAGEECGEGLDCDAVVVIVGGGSVLGGGLELVKHLVEGLDSGEVGDGEGVVGVDRIGDALGLRSGYQHYSAGCGE